MSLRRISALALLMLCVGSTAAKAESNPLLTQQIAQKPEAPGGMMHRDRDRAGLIQQLNLTPDQQKQLEAIRQKSKNDMEQPRQALRQAEQKLQDLMTGTATEDQIRDQYKQVQQLKQQMAALGFENLLASRKVLTPEQRQKFAQLMEQRRGQFGNRSGKPSAPPQ